MSVGPYMRVCRSNDDLIASRRYNNRIEFRQEVRQVINKFFNTRLMTMDDISDVLLDMNKEVIDAAEVIKMGGSETRQQRS